MADDASLHALLSGPLKVGRGRKGASLQVGRARELTAADLVSLATPGETKPFEIKELRQTHHRLAQALSQGLPDQDVALICGYSISRISVLKADPMFKELLAYYEGMEEEHYAVARADMHERLKNLGFDSLEVLHEQILDGKIEDPKILLAIVEASADRVGHGKTSTVNHQHDHSISDSALARIKAATALGRPLQETDRGALLRLAASRTAEVHPTAEAADWIEGEGALLREEGGEGTSPAVAAGGTPLPPVD